MGLKETIKTARFHYITGPQSLFDRVYYKMSSVHHLALHGNHYNERMVERDIPKLVLDKINKFDIKEWLLVGCEVRTDKGKFINSTWEMVYEGQRYWIVIGFNNLVMTVIKKNSAGNEGAITCGDLYEYVRSVNEKLMAEI